MAARHMIFALMLTTALPAAAGTVRQTNLVSDGAVPAKVTDPNLKNAWGVSYAPGGPFWVSDNASGLSTLYKGHGSIVPLVVTIPPAAGGTTGSPTGQVYNPTSDFVVSANGQSGPASFIFATEDGTISGWNFSVSQNASVVVVDRSEEHAVYKGIALYTDGSGSNYLLATDFHNGTIDVFDGSFNRVAWFRDPTLGHIWSPYNIAILNGNIYVTYAQVDPARHDSVSGPGKGALEEIDFSGHVIARVMHGQLNAPWGLTLAPASWGHYAGDILVGNFGNGWVPVFTQALAPRGFLKTSGGWPLAIDGLWGLIPGNDGSGGSSSNIYFTSGPNGETDGLFGSLSYVP